jgi:PAS domain S-box-containing protein
MGGVTLGPGHLTTIATADLQVITRSRDAAAWAGQYLPRPENRDEVVGPGRRVVSGPDAENVQRAWGIASVPGLGWEAYVGVAEEEVNAPAVRATARRVGTTAFFLLLGILVATGSYRQIAGSLRELVARTRTAEHGHVFPLPEGTPREVSAVLEQLDRTLAERDAAEAAERQALERYASIFNEAVFGIFVATPDGWILEANPALASMLGAHEIRQIIDTPLRRYFIDPDQHDIMLATCLAEDSVEGFLAEWTRVDGAAIVVRIDGKRLRTVTGEEAIEMIVDDVTEELRRDRQIQQTQKMEAIGRLAGGIAHDFNNLLTVISANAELIEEGLPEGSALRPDLEQIQRAGDRAAALTRQLLAFSRSDASEVQAVDLNAVVADLDAMLHRLIGDDIRLETSLDPELPVIQADPSRIEQVIMNLVLNARDALPKGGTIRIATTLVPASSVEGKASQSEILLTVEDDGEGMDHVTRGRIFEPFFTTKGEGRGTGLGLATVYGIVQQAGGRIEVESHLARGSRFLIWLPVRAAA